MASKFLDITGLNSLWAKIKNTFVKLSDKGAADGVASLDSDAKLPTSQLPVKNFYASEAKTILVCRVPYFSSTSGGVSAFEMTCRWRSGSAKLFVNLHGNSQNGSNTVSIIFNGSLEIDSLKFYRVKVTVDEKSYFDIYVSVPSYHRCFIAPSVPSSTYADYSVYNDNATMPEIGANTEADESAGKAILIDAKFVAQGVSSSGDAPVKVDASGNLSAVEVDSSPTAGNSTHLVSSDGVKTALDGKSPSTHTHGNITNGGALQTNDITIASGDKIVITDSSDSSKIARASVSFDGSTTTKALTQKGTFETFLQSHQDISGKEDKSNKVIAWQSTPDNTHYPSEKLVKDELKNRVFIYRGLSEIDSSYTWNNTYPWQVYNAMKDNSIAYLVLQEGDTTTADSRWGFSGVSITYDLIIIMRPTGAYRTIAFAYPNDGGEAFYMVVKQNATGTCTWRKLLHSGSVTSSYSSTGTSPVNGAAIAAALGTLDVSTVGGAGKYISAISETDGKISATATSMDTTPTASSTNAVTSGGVAAALSLKASSDQGLKADSAIQSVKVNGTALTPDSNKAVNIPLASSSAHGAMSKTDKSRLDGIASGAQVNVIESVKVNGTAQTITSKAVDIAVPTASTTSPKMDGTASAGSETTWAKGDHRHPTDTSREAAANKKTALDDTSDTDFPTSKAVGDYVGTAIADKQDTIADLSDIRSGAAAGATAVQPATMQAEFDKSSDVIVTYNTETGRTHKYWKFADATFSGNSRYLFSEWDVILQTNSTFYPFKMIFEAYKSSRSAISVRYAKIVDVKSGTSENALGATDFYVKVQDGTSAPLKIELWCGLNRDNRSSIALKELRAGLAPSTNTPIDTRANSWTYHPNDGDTTTSTTKPVTGDGYTVTQFTQMSDKFAYYAERIGKPSDTDGNSAVTSQVGSKNIPIYIKSDGSIDECDVKSTYIPTGTGSDAPVNGKALKNALDSGTAAKAVIAEKLVPGQTGIGNAFTPIYVTNDGTPTICDTKLMFVATYNSGATGVTNTLFADIRNAYNLGRIIVLLIKGPDGIAYCGTLSYIDATSARFFVCLQESSSGSLMEIGLNSNDVWSVHSIKVTFSSQGAPNGALGSQSNPLSLVYSTSFVGNLDGAATRLGNTYAVGGSTRPVYFTANGVPLATDARFVYAVNASGQSITTQYKICVGDIGTDANTLYFT